MSNLKEAFAHNTVLIIFIISVIIVQITPINVGLLLAVMMFIISFYASKENRKIWLTISIYIIGYWIAVYLHSYVVSIFEVSREANIVLSRLSLLGYIIPYFILMKISRPQTDYLSVGSFKNTIYTPFIWRGIKDPVWRFLLIGTAVMFIAFIFVIDFDQYDFYRLIMYGGLFAIVNSVLEELLWRGLMLPRFVDHAGEKLGLLVTSTGFGFYHYSIGFPWTICALFSLCGLLMGGVAIRSKGLVPVMILHFNMNVLFALSGIIF
ncbi:CAAX amino terminal protease self- immunity [compost metagenome]